MSFECPKICEFIRRENLKSLIEHIALKHLSSKPDIGGKCKLPSIEEISSPYVDTLTLLRKKYEENVNALKSEESCASNTVEATNQPTSEKALEDQVSTPYLLFSYVVILDL